MNKKYRITTQKELRKLFWEQHPEFVAYYKASKTQNDYPADIRMAWVDFVELNHRDGFISGPLANRATL